MSKTSSLSFILAIMTIFLFNSNEAFSQNTYKVATIDSKVLFEFVPGKKRASVSIEELNNKYKKELALMQNEYINKYTVFQKNQNSLAESIKLRRMQELYELEQNINNFMKIAQEDVTSQEEQLIKPLHAILTEAIRQVGVEQSYICIYDLANPAISFVTPNAIDANSLVQAKLQSK